MIPLVLASASPSRRRILEQAGIDPIVRPSTVDEQAIMAAMPDGTPSVRLVEHLARAKAENVAGRARELAGEAGTEAGRIALIGCDSLLMLGDQLKGKPHTIERGRERWNEMRGRHAVLITGHCVLVIDAHTGETVFDETATSDTTVHFGWPSDADIDAYLHTGEPLESAGAFTLESLGGWFIDRIVGDPSSVIGLSLPLLRRLFSEAGINVRELWRPELLD